MARGNKGSRAAAHQAVHAVEPVSIQQIRREFALEMLDRLKAAEVRLKDHAKEGGQEALWGVAAKVADKTGRLLTRDEHDTHGDDWWSPAATDPCVGKDCEMPGDRVSIPPGQSVRRMTELGTLLANCPGLTRGLDHIQLPAGTYTVQLSLNGLASAPIQIVVD